MNRIILSIDLTVRSPFLFSGISAAPFGMDACALRNGSGELLIPQDQVRGVLRHALEEVRLTTGGKAFAQTDVATLFGEASTDPTKLDPEIDNLASASANIPLRGRLLFDDLVAAAPDAPYEVGRAVRVEINPETRAAKEGHLMMVELAAPSGVDVAFKGRVILFATNDEAKTWLSALAAATSYVSAIGAMKTAGFGEVVDFVVSEVRRAALTPDNMPPVAAERCRYKLTIDRPFLVDSRRDADNVYIGSEIIPGAALKGLLARKLELCGKMPEKDEWLTKLAFSHAKPEGAGGVLPLSLVAANGKIGDALETPLGKGVMIGDFPARFQIDWKSDEKERAKELFAGAPTLNLDRDVRTHVAIEQEFGSAAESMLYVTNAVVPYDHSWIVDVDYSGVTDDAARARLRAMLESGLDGLGRTGASISLKPCDERTNATGVKPVHWQKDAYAVILDSDAIMVSPEDEKAPFVAYAEYWRRVCPEAELLNFYASQRLAGGYVALRGYEQDVGYRPFWLTESGSVFLLAGDIESRLTELVRGGLPAPQVDGKELDWRRCIYQPENGYGKIRVDYNAEPTQEVRHV